MLMTFYFYMHSHVIHICYLLLNITGLHGLLKFFRERDFTLVGSVTGPNCTAASGSKEPPRTNALGGKSGP